MVVRYVPSSSMISFDGKKSLYLHLYDLRDMILHDLDLSIFLT